MITADEYIFCFSYLSLCTMVYVCSLFVSPFCSSKLIYYEKPWVSSNGVVYVVLAFFFDAYNATKQVL